MPVNLNENFPRIQAFLATHNVGILATASVEGVPHAATVYFVIEPELKIYFMTRMETTKFRNLNTNPHAALAIFDAPSQTTVQAAGNVKEISDSATQDAVYNKVLAITKATSGDHLPPIAKLDAGKYVVYQLEPTLLRMAEFVKAEYPPVDQLFEIAIP